ncbi:MAG TPA: efflux RND transporter permease subunit [Longimicrobium sp.]|nr:efflux RND transporter permease subunit [Longimicrobium sp.]
MFISDFAIKRPTLTVVSMLALVVFGIFALMSLDTDEFPEVEAPFIFLALPYPGASPDIVEREVVDPVEEAIAGISGVDRVTSSSMDGFGSIFIEFVYGKNVQEASQDVRDAISQIRGELPQEMEEPIQSNFDPNDQPIVQLTLSSASLDPASLTRLADPAITSELRTVTGVGEVRVVGGVERELTVEVSPTALQAAGIGMPQVVQALQTQNLAVPVGRLTGQFDERSIRLRGRLERPEEFMALTVAERNGQPITLGEVARVRDGTEEARSIALFNGQPAVGIDIVKAQGHSTTAVAEGVLARLVDVRKTLPKSARLDVLRNSGERVRNSVANVEESLLVGALLTILVVFVFLNSWRSTVITGLALPVSVLASFVAVWAFDFTLNTMSLLGLSLAIGILIDDAIVVRENIVRHVEMGKDHHTAAREGTDEIGLAVAATTFSIVCVFIPIAFMGGLAEQWFAPFALTIASSVLVSLFVSFSLDPMLSAYWPDPHREEHEKWWITRVLDRFNRWFDRQAQRYRRVVAWALDHALAMIVIAIGSLQAAMALPGKGAWGFLLVMAIVVGVVLVLTIVPFPRGLAGGLMKTVLVVGAFMAMGPGVQAVPEYRKLGFELFPADDQSEIIMGVETPPGSNLEYTRLKAEEVAAAARRYEEVAYTYTTVGGGGMTGAGSVDEASIYVRLIPKAERPGRSQQDLSADIRRDALRIGGATAAVVTDMFGGMKQIQVQLRGPDITVLNRLASQIESEVREVPGAVDVGLSTKGQKPELTVELNRGLAGSLGVSAGQVAQALRPAFAGLDAGDWVDPSGETRDVVVRFAPEARARTADLQSVPLVFAGTRGPVTVPLGQVATVRHGVGPAQIDHLQRDRVINVEANTQGVPLSEVVTGIQAKLDSVRVPAGYQVTFGGQTEDQTEIFGRIMFALLVAVMLMYLILVVQFGSFLDPMAIMLSLPLSLIGVMLGLWLTGSTLNIMSMIGIILLMGIVAKNAILLIDFAKWSKERGMSRREALITAGAIRLRPILMTTFALIAGMIPVALGRGEGAQFRAPMGIAVIGGVITSTLLTLLVVPTVWELLDELRDWTGAKLRRGRGGGHGHAPTPHEPSRHDLAGREAIGTGH